MYNDEIKLFTRIKKKEIETLFKNDKTYSEDMRMEIGTDKNHA